jgi:tRNA-splicing ligase RtcB (3'-phosphate/5'-hydroxy nucleic acid ligase)
MERKYKIRILDRELACAPFNSIEGQNYFKAMKCAVNMSFANRQVILHRVREVFSEVFKQDAEKLGMHQVFDVTHNRAALEKHKVDGKTKEVVVHRKGATGSYPAGRDEIPKLYKNDGSPVIIGGSMETGSYLLVGAEKATETFCSTCHGSGRTMSRTQARKMVRGEELQKDMEKRGIYVKTVSFSGLAEESGISYKEIDEVVRSVDAAGLSKRVVKLVPLGNVKG